MKKARLTEAPINRTLSVTWFPFAPGTLFSDMVDAVMTSDVFVRRTRGKSGRCPEQTANKT